MDQGDRDARQTAALTALGLASENLQSVNVSLHRRKRAVVVLAAVFALALFVGLPFYDWNRRNEQQARERAGCEQTNRNREDLRGVITDFVLGPEATANRTPEQVAQAQVFVDRVFAGRLPIEVC